MVGVLHLSTLFIVVIFFEHHWIFFFYYFAHFRQTLFKIGLVLYLAVWEVSREGKYSNLSVEVVVVVFFFFKQPIM